MTTEMIERDVALRVAVGDPEPVSVEDAAALVAEIRRLRAAVERVRDQATKMLAKTDLSGGAYHKTAQMFLRALNGET